MTHERILIVEDDADLRAALSSVLNIEGFRVVGASNGAEALARLREDASYSLVLLDLVMPVMDGWQFRNAQVADPAIAAIPVVAITARGNHAAPKVLHVDAFLEKPLQLPLLLETIRRCLRGNAAPATPPTG